MPTAPALPVVWRPRWGRWVPHGLLPVVAGLLAWMGYVMTAGARPKDLVLYALIGTLALAGLYLLGRPRLAAHDSGLTVVNVFSRRELEWAEVVGVSMSEGEPWPTFDLADGTTMATMGIQASDGERARRELASLRALLDSRGTGAGPADPERRDL